MLKIENYYKLCNKAVGDRGWTVGYCNEQPEWYEIKLYNNRLQATTIRLSRIPSLSPGGLTIYRFMDNKANHQNRAVTADFIRNIENMLRTLNKFVTI